MKNRKKKKLLVWYLFSLMFFFSISSTMIGTIIPKISEDYHLSFVQIGLIGSIQSIGGLIATVFGGILSDRFSKLKLIGLTFGCFTMILCLVGIVPPYALLISYFLLIGITSNYLSLLISACLPEIVEGNLEFYMNMSHAFFGLGSLAGPVYALVVMKLGFGWNRIFLILGALCAVILSPYFRIAGNSMQKRSVGKEIPEKKTISKILTDWRMLWISLVCLLYMGQQSVINLWIAPYFQDVLKSAYAGIALSLYWAGVMAGRFLVSYLSQKIDSRKFLCFGCFMSSGLWMLALPFSNFVLMILCLCINGVLTGATFPVCISMACMYQPQQTGTATSMVCLAGSAGGSFLTWLAGVIVGNYSYTVGLSMVPVTLLICAVLLLVMQTDASHA